MPPPTIIRRYYPALSSVVSLDDFPESLGFLKQAIQQLFDKIHYKDLQYKKSPKGDAAFYSLSIVSKKLSIELLGSGISLVLNPDETVNADFNISAFPVTVEYQWKVLAYLRSFNLNNFSFSPQEIFELALVVLNISEEQAIAQFINTFTVPVANTLPLQQFINDIKTYNSDPIIQTLNFTVTDDTKIKEVTQAINQHTGKYGTLYGFGAYLLKNNVNETKDKLGKYFKTFVPQDIEAYLKDILLPKARATLTVSAAIEFPRKILYPYKLNGAIWEREPENSGVLSRFYFGKVLFYADTVGGVGYNLELVGDLRPKYCEIGKTGLLIQLEKLKLDLSDKINIPEADADGRPVDFRGVYAEALSVTLPAKWFKTGTNTNGSTLRIGGYDLLIGTGGVSGSFALEAVPTQSSTNGDITDFFTSKFNFVYPITGFINNPSTNQQDQVPIANHTALLSYLNSLEHKSLYRFKYPLSISPVGGAQLEFNYQQEFRNYITGLIVADNGTMWFNIGSQEKGFLIGFKSFDITFKQNRVTSSNIKGSLIIKKFKSSANPNAPLQIDLEGHLYDDGDFGLTASIPGGLEANLFNFVNFNFLTFELGRQEDKFYLGTSCEVWFNNPIMAKIFGDQKIILPRVRIYSNGQMEIVGGNAFIPTNLSLHLGPIDISVTGIYFGSYQQSHNGVQRKYNYFGFDGAISIDPLGVDGKGKGIKYYYSVDDGDTDANGNPLNLPHHSFIRVETIEVDLIIPGSANPASAIAIIHGMISIPEPGESPEYVGEVSLKLPKAKMAGGAAMKLQPKSPAFIIDAFIDLPAPIPIGPVGIYGFRGLIGFRYVAEKEAVGLVSGVDTWYDYYTYPPKGIHVTKFSGPERTKNYSFPFSIGAGAVLGTSFDSGTVISIRAMLLLSIPTLFMIEGRATIISARLGLTDDNEPPFFAFIAWGDNSLELGLGADFKLPQDSGWIIDLHAEVQAAFFFKNSSRWYVNFGTKQEPISARILTIITAQSYLMISAKGIETGARVQFDLNKRFGPAKVRIYAYVEVGGHISFERPQIGGYLAFGGMIDIDIWIIGITIGLDAVLSVEAAKPFLLYAELRIKVCVKILFKKVCKSFTIELRWEKDQTVDRTPVAALPNTTNSGQQDRTEELVKGVNMLTNQAFELQYFANIPGENAITAIIPLDTYIDIKTAKGLIPNAVSAKIGGHTSGAENFTDLVSPESISRGGRQLRQVKHTYSIEAIEIKAWTGSQWVDYHPYQAIIEGEVVTNLRIGYWQRSGNQYDTIRLLATNPFSFTAAGEPGWFIPEEYGITPSSLFCKTKEETPHCSNVLNKAVGTIYYPPQQYTAHFINGAYYTLLGGNIYDPASTGIAGLNGDFMKVTDAFNPFGFAKSLSFNNYNQMVILLPDPSVSVKLYFTTNAAGATVSYYRKLINDTSVTPQYELLHSVHKTAGELSQELTYINTNTAIAKVIIAPDEPNAAAINAVLQQIAALFNTTYENGSGEVTITEPSDPVAYQALLAQLASLQSQGCSSSTRYFFSNFYGFNNAALRALYFKDIVKLGEYYFVSAEVSKVGETTGNSTSIIFKINGNGIVVAEKLITGIVTTMTVKNNELLVTVAKRDAITLFLEIPSLIRLDASLDQLAGIDLEQILNYNFNQLCLIPGTDYAYWFSSSQSDRTPAADVSAFVNGTRILLINTGTLQILDSVLIEAQVAKKAVVNNDGTAFFISAANINTQDNTVVSISLTANNTISLAGAYTFNGIPNDIALASSGDMIITGKSSQSGVSRPFLGLFTSSNLTICESGDFGQEDLYLNNSSLQNGQVTIVAYNSTRAFTMTTQNGLSISAIKQIITPVLTGPAFSIHKIISNPDTKEVYMLSGKPDNYTGEAFTVMDELLNSCMFNAVSVGPKFAPAVLPVFIVNITLQNTVILKTPAANLVAASQYINTKTALCPPVVNPAESINCVTSLQEIQWLTVAQHEYNYTIPGQDAIALDQQAMVEAMQKTAQPVWRPNTKYYVHFRLKDTVDNGNSAPGIYDYYYGFKTVGPLGHYHKDPLVTYVPSESSPDQYPLTSLRQYIDYNRSYPNADGNLLQAKPLFYGNSQCKISIFFASAFAYHMLQKWYAYNGLPELSGEIHIAIKDPVTDVIIPYPLPANWTSETVPLPTGGVVWTGDNDPRIPPNIRMLNNMINYINSHFNTIQCTLTIGHPIKPAAYTYGVTLTNLAPRKLYTAIVYNAFEAASNNVIKSEQVHQFVFQTSRYASFEEQVNSYILKDDAANEKQAVFKIPLTVTAANISTAYNIITGVTDPLSTVLETKYANLFDRVTEGIFGFKPIDPAVTTEFNLLKDSSTTDTIGILIRNPEPFNIPKIPLQEIGETIVVLTAGGQVDADYQVLFSKDYAQALVMHSSKKITAAELLFRFKYKVWNGSAYITYSTIVTPQILLNI